MRVAAGDGGVDGVLDLGAGARGALVEGGLEFGGEEEGGDGADELDDEGAEGDQGLEGVAVGLVLEGLGGEADLVGQVVGVVDEVGGEVVEVGWREGMGMATVLEGIEVALGRAGAAGA